MTDAKGMTMTVLRSGAPAWPRTVTVMGVLASHDQDLAHDLPDGLRLAESNPLSRPAVLLDVRALYQTSEQRQVVAVPAVPTGDGQWRRDERSWQASGAYVVADDSRLHAFLHDLSGYAYDPAVPLHDRTED